MPFTIQLIYVMEHNKQPENFQDHMATHIIKQGYTIYGGYVYKRLLNGDKTNDIDVHVTNKEDMYSLSKNLTETFGCKEERLYMDDMYWDIDPYVIGMRMSCLCKQQNFYSIDLIFKNMSQNNDIFKLEYKQINEKPQIVHKNGLDEQAKKTIKELKQRQFAPWENMREKDKQYFSNGWTDTSLYSFKIKKLFGLVE